MRKVYIDFLRGGDAAVYDTDPRWVASVLSYSGKLVRAARPHNRVCVPLLVTKLDSILTKVERVDPEADVIIPWRRGDSGGKNDLLIGLLIRSRRKEVR